MGGELGAHDAGAPARLFAPCSLSSLCTQPARRPEIHDGSHRDIATWPSRAGGPQRFISRMLLQGNHAVLPPSNTKLPSALNSSTSVFWECY